MEQFLKFYFFFFLLIFLKLSIVIYSISKRVSGVQCPYSKPITQLSLFTVNQGFLPCQTPPPHQIFLLVFDYYVLVHMLEAVLAPMILIHTYFYSTSAQYHSCYF